MINRFSIPLGLISVVLMASLLDGCRKVSPFAISGLVSDPNQSVPVEGATLIFKKDEYFGWTSDLNMDKIKSEHGHYAEYQYALIQWSKRKNGGQIFKTETYFIKAFETSEINFNY